MKFFLFSQISGYASPNFSSFIPPFWSGITENKVPLNLLRRDCSRSFSLPRGRPNCRLEPRIHIPPAIMARTTLETYLHIKLMTKRGVNGMHKWMDQALGWQNHLPVLTGSSSFLFCTVAQSKCFLKASSKLPEQDADWVPLLILGSGWGEG